MTASKNFKFLKPSNIPNHLIEKLLLLFLSIDVETVLANINSMSIRSQPLFSLNIID